VPRLLCARLPEDAEGIGGLGDRLRTGRKPRLTELERSKVITLVVKNPPGKLLTEARKWAPVVRLFEELLRICKLDFRTNHQLLAQA
jgi:hypothetical protein